MNRKLWLSWTLNCAAGELLGLAAAGALAFGVNTIAGEPQTLPMKLFVLFSMMLAGAVEGSVLSFFQAIRPQGPSLDLGQRPGLDLPVRLSAQ